VFFGIFYFNNTNLEERLCLKRQIGIYPFFRKEIPTALSECKDRVFNIIFKINITSISQFYTKHPFISFSKCKLHPNMNSDTIIKIAIVGPESTGKSWLTQQLATHYNTLFVPEYAREYCQGLNRSYTLEDEINIFHGQLALEEKLIQKTDKSIIFFDTMVLTVKVWCDHLFGFTPIEVLQGIKKQHYDLYLLMDIDLPWQEDELRDFPNLRKHFMEIWHHELQDASVNYEVVSGTGNTRFITAKNIVDNFLAENKI